MITESTVARPDPTLGGLRVSTAAPTARPRAVLVPFALFCLYALLRWQTMWPHVRWRGWASLALALIVAIAVSGRLQPPTSWPAAGRRRIRIGGLVVVALAGLTILLALCGIPLEWISHARLALTLQTIGNGISTMPTLTVPYRGGYYPTHLILQLGGGLLMLAAALSLHGVLAVPGPSPRLLQRRLAICALLLTLMAMVPSIVVEPQQTTVHALITFVLVMLLLYAWRVPRGNDFGALILLAAAGVCGLLIAGAVHPRHGLLTVNKIVSSFGPAKAIRFDWNQTYGPLGPEHASAVVLQVHARHPAYWKAEDLDQFNGVVWSAGPLQIYPNRTSAQILLGVSRASRKRWTQQLSFTDVDFHSNNLVASGSAQMPLVHRLMPAVFAGASPGTWIVTEPLTPGLNYNVTAYTPDPSVAQLGAAGTGYPSTISDHYLDLTLPRYSIANTHVSVWFSPYSHAGSLATEGRYVWKLLRNGAGYRAAYATTSLDDASQVETVLARNSDLAGVYALATRLQSGTRTPYQYLENIERYLHHGFVYTRNPPRSKNPIPAFLLHTHHGYCQQFAGAMALLLRMGGVPARVAAGFTTGSYDRSKHLYTVRANNAHAWVEVWFPHYGWVSFDPTVAGKHTAAGTVTTPVGSGDGGGSTALRPHGPIPAGHTLGGHRLIGPTSHAGTAVQASKPGVPVSLIVLGALLLAALLACAVWITRWPRFGRRTPAQLTRELERAFRRCGRPIKRGVTLAQLEQTLRETSPAAAEYVKGVQRSRFTDVSSSEPSREQRRALRAWLGHGRGIRGHLTALVALPPCRSW